MGMCCVCGVSVVCVEVGCIGGDVLCRVYMCGMWGWCGDMCCVCGALYVYVRCVCVVCMVCMWYVQFVWGYVVCVIYVRGVLCVCHGFSRDFGIDSFP